MTYTSYGTSAHRKPKSPYWSTLSRITGTQLHNVFFVCFKLNSIVLPFSSLHVCYSVKLISIFGSKISGIFFLSNPTNLKPLTVKFTIFAQRSGSLPEYDREYFQNFSRNEQTILKNIWIYLKTPFGKTKHKGEDFCF